MNNYMNSKTYEVTIKFTLTNAEEFEKPYNEDRIMNEIEETIQSVLDFEFDSGIATVTHCKRI